MRNSTYFGAAGLGRTKGIVDPAPVRTIILQRRSTYVGSIVVVAEMLIRVRDKINDDFYLNCQCTKRGDVIVVCPPFWTWGSEELTNPDWRILRVYMQESEAQSFAVPELPVDPQNPSKTLQKRLFKIDLDNLPQDLINALASDLRETPIVDVLIDIRDYKLTKPPIDDPAQFGGSPNIF